MGVSLHMGPILPLKGFQLLPAVIQKVQVEDEFSSADEFLGDLLPVSEHGRSIL